jgi:hypothetical protein
MVPRNYMIIPITELSAVPFAEVLENSSTTIRSNVAQDKFIIKWDDHPPLCTELIEGTEGPYTQSEMKAILDTSAWTDFSSLPS